MDAGALLKDGPMKVLVKPGAKKTEILGWDEGQEALRVGVAAPPEENKANRELVKFFSRLAGGRVRIVRGFASREKVLSL